MNRPVLPTYYYLDHFSEMLDFVAATYGAVLTDENHAFVCAFRRLSKDAQCLLVRMVNRRGALFNRSLFKYPEIADLELAAGDLLASGHARGIIAEDYAAFVSCLPKEELLAGARAARYSDVRSSWSKPKLIEYYLAEIPFAIASDRCGGDRFIALDNVRPIEFLLYLYFGKTEDDLKNFALRDLGILRTNKASSFSARFTDADEARACFHYSQVLDRLEVGIYESAVIDVLEGPLCLTRYAADLRSRAAFKAGQLYERRGDGVVAQNLYRVGSSPDCHERLVRLLFADGERSGAEELLRRMIDDPASDGEYIFATDFYARKFGGRRIGQCTALLRSGRTLVVDDAYRGNPEAGVAAVLRRQGYKVFFAENVLWHTLFGLLFWDELFESGQLHSGFDWTPHCLKDRSFAGRFTATIGTKLEAIRSGAALNLLLKTIAGKWGRPNGVFAWDRFQVEAVRVLLQSANREGLSAIVRLMCEDFQGMRDGFPDLLLEKDGAVSFMEIKAEGDAIRRNQLTRLRQLGEAGLIAEIGRIDFRFDSDQDYVVVDVETTGGRARYDRITEIGAVKIRNHEIVGEWRSLINPQRPIPISIIRLTGISDDMVRGAPLFAEVASRFLEFMGDSVFVAHNVNFDYGFISAEYERLEQRFRFPKLCTCASMRRHYPGQKSYSLGNLCEVYDIKLERHHRALYDARASAHLLNLINRKREAAEATGVEADAA
jgi:DNA polymerase III subunit epsilon